ncbi:DNA-damage-inducible protein F [Cutibacterium acnes JCM 18920]|nr:DNA-damage-inducible protein F [Cutibacterium acnes JCM 18920]
MVRGGRDPGSEVGAGYRQILNLAVPAFLSLIAEPLFLVADSAVVGHLAPPSWQAWVWLRRP